MTLQNSEAEPPGEIALTEVLCNRSESRHHSDRTGFFLPTFPGSWSGGKC